MGSDARAISTQVQALRDQWSVVEAFVVGLGSSLDLATLARRTSDLLRDQLGLADTVLCLVDASARQFEIHGPRPAQWDRVDATWPLTDALVQRLRQGVTLVPIEASELPDGVPVRATLHGLRLTDGNDMVGIVLLPPGFDAAGLDGFARERLRVVGALIGATFSRALVHQVLVDVTARLDAAQRLQRHILDHVSHEFNTPLMILKSAAEFSDTDDHDERTAFLDMHAQALDRLEELVQGVLEVARSHAHVRLQNVRARELREAVVEPAFSMRPWPEHRRQIAWGLRDDVQLRTDPDGIGLVLDHVLRNAWQYGGNAGASIAIRVYAGRSTQMPERGDHAELGALFEATRRGAALGTPTEPVNADRCIIEIIDTGIGIPAAELDFVLEPFTQASNSPLRGVSGAGMGLPTSRTRMESLGGRLVLDSIEGRGTRVVLSLPL